MIIQRLWEKKQRLPLAMAILAGMVFFIAYSLRDESLAMFELKELAQEKESLTLPPKDTKPRHKTNPANIFTDIALIDLEKVKELQEIRDQDSFFDAETIGLAQDVVHAAGRVSYFPARQRLIDHLKSDKHASRLEEIILKYDQSGFSSDESPVLAHFSIIALGELSRDEGIARGAKLYAALSKHLSELESEESSKSAAARLTDIYDLTRHIISNQIGDKNSSWEDILDVFEQLKIREHYLSDRMKQELKNAVASVSSLETLSDLNELNEKLDSFWN